MSAFSDIGSYPDYSSPFAPLAFDAEAICSDESACPHPYLHKWDGMYICQDCRYELNDSDEARERNADRIAEEERLERETPTDLIKEGMSEGKLSASRGVKLGFLLSFTKQYDCWEWTSWDIVRKIIKPATQSLRCRAMELPEMQAHVGPAQTFLSYAQAGKWGDVVAALLDGGADPDRCVWIDIFAVRQWPSDNPDLDFASTIEHCSSFVIVCSYLHEVANNSGKKSDPLPVAARKQICFMRVWCLVEAHKACSMPDMPIIMKIGAHRLVGDGSLVFDATNVETMADLLVTLVDVENAEATVESDRKRIINDVRAGVGLDQLNSAIRGAITGCGPGYDDVLDKSRAIAPCAACGDEIHRQTILSDPSSIFLLAQMGFINLLQDILLTAGADVNAKDEGGATAVMLGAGGWTALMKACGGGHNSCVSLLLNSGADINAKQDNGVTALMYASWGGHGLCVSILLAAGADVETKSDTGYTALIMAAARGHDSCVSILLKAGADVHAKKDDNSTALKVAKTQVHDSCVALLLEAEDI